MVSVTIVAALLDAFGRSMSWYAKPWLILFLYVTPTVFAVMAVFNFAMAKQRKIFRYRMNS